MKKSFNSIIKKYFPIELLIELYEISESHTIQNNNKSKMIMEALSKFNVPAQSLGSGTNRYGVLIDGYAVKIALDRRGQTDNKREMKYSKQLQPYVIKIYECTHDGLVAVSEYINTFSELSELYTHQYEMKDMLSDICANFLVGDIGVTEKNFMNWGRRFDGSLCIMDFAYIYSLSYQGFVCTCDHETILEYDDDFVNLYCPSCRKKFTFGDIRRRITKQDEINEIGDIMSVGYRVSSEREELEVIPELSNNKTESRKQDSNKEKKNKIEEQDWDTFVDWTEEEYTSDKSINWSSDDTKSNPEVNWSSSDNESNLNINWRETENVSYAKIKW